MGPRTRLVILMSAAVALTGCGGGSHFADRQQPAAPINVSVYVNDQRVAVSPGSVTIGAVAITITNQSSGAQSMEIIPAGGSSPITTTGPISPQATDQVTVDLGAGAYSVGIAPNSSAQAAASTPAGIVPGSLLVQGRRPGSNNQLGQP